MLNVAVILYGALEQEVGVTGGLQYRTHFRMEVLLGLCSL
jgi:hypothetical protein